jgi:hypothetical protein
MKPQATADPRLANKMPPEKVWGTEERLCLDLSSQFGSCSAGSMIGRRDEGFGAAAGLEAVHFGDVFSRERGWQNRLPETITKTRLLETCDVGSGYVTAFVA